MWTSCYQYRTLLVVFLFFFFSSRRRHTRYWRDWSSDVCSSDLRRGPFVLSMPRECALRRKLLGSDKKDKKKERPKKEQKKERSEERRVGKECKTRGRQ